MTHKIAKVINKLRCNNKELIFFYVNNLENIKIQEIIKKLLKRKKIPIKNPDFQRCISFIYNFNLTLKIGLHAAAEACIAKASTSHNLIFIFEY